ncbi:DUF3982 domain-containing protein [Bacillus sp. A17A.1]
MGICPLNEILTPNGEHPGKVVVVEKLILYVPVTNIFKVSVPL